MGAVDTPEPSGKGKKGGLRRPKRRVRIRIDMTPMVDVAFLLLIFFMVTTVFRKPQAMEVNLPPKDAKVQVPESNVHDPLRPGRPEDLLPDGEGADRVDGARRS